MREKQFIGCPDQQHEKENSCYNQNQNCGRFKLARSGIFLEQGTRYEQADHRNENHTRDNRRMGAQ